MRILLRRLDLKLGIWRMWIQHAIARFFAAGSDYELIRIPTEVNVRDTGQRIVLIQFDDGTYVAGERTRDGDAGFLDLAASVAGPGSIPDNAAKLTRGEPL